MKILYQKFVKQKNVLRNNVTVFTVVLVLIYNLLVIHLCKTLQRVNKNYFVNNFVLQKRKKSFILNVMKNSAIKNFVNFKNVYKVMII